MYLLSASAILMFCTNHAASISSPESSTPPVLDCFDSLAPRLPMSSYNTDKFARPLELFQAVIGENASVTTIHGDMQEIKRIMPELRLPDWNFPNTRRDLFTELEHFEKRQATCSNPRVRIEWDTYTSADKQAWVNSVKCLLRNPPSGRFPGSQNRYEDLVVLHQQMTPRVHGNAMFLLWHRYLLWVFEDMLRRECGFTRPFPWWDEARYAGRFQQSSIFSAQWLGTMMARGDCVRNGQFANLASNIGPGTRNQRHCLSRNGDESKTANTKQSITEACNARNTFADMAACTEGGAHAWGHNGIGAVMQDVYGSPADPVFWLHHAYIDRNFRNWQNRDARRRTTTVGGTDGNGRGITLNTGLTMSGLRPDVRVGDILNTQSSTLCYRYSY
ncbi:hypothetical protein DE146DRAFT_651376 [Phaeosphaeria sp. MPI-PUGE-AT-0046c]|nr:hypothetical protein DE146DRAFT_651376 [Phaeosphaeria sp. MPI-PUGE-AT-0046c]